MSKELQLLTDAELAATVSRALGTKKPSYVVAPLRCLIGWVAENDWSVDKARPLQTALSFLANWRGEDAKVIKAELRRRLNTYQKR